MTIEKKFRVAVCGGGIAGLTCAVALSKYPDIDIDIYEGASQFGEIGAGIGVWLRVRKVLERLGLREDLVQMLGFEPTDEPVVTMVFRKSDQPQGIEFHQLVANGGLLTVHRADFQKMLLKHLSPACRTHCSKRLASYEQLQDGPIRLLFADGSTEACDVLIGADGLKSSVRRTMLHAQAEDVRRGGRLDEAEELLDAIDPVWADTVYRALVPVDRLEIVVAKNPSASFPTRPTQYIGQNAYMIAYPISQGKMINLVAHHFYHDRMEGPCDGPWFVTVDKAELLGAHSGWEPEVQTLLQCVDNPIKWAVHTTKPLRSLVHGRVILIGDAAHAMTTHQGSGAGQAIEDAYVLATLLGHPKTTIQTLPLALSIHDAIRRPFSTDIAERSLETGQQLTLGYGGFDFDTSPPKLLEDRLRELGRVVTDRWEWSWTTTLDGATEEAVDMLENAL